MAELTIEKLLESGAHFGHQTRRWNPQMRPYILAARNDIHLINLEKTLEAINVAKKKIAEIVSKGGNVLFVGTKPQAKDSVKEIAESCKQFYVCERWLGGMLTNYTTIRQSLNKVEEIDKFEKDGTFKFLPKKEVNILGKKREKILNYLGGIRNMKKVPGAVFIVDTNKEHIAVEEANRLKIPIIAIVDTNCDPSKISNPIPANDDSLKTVQLILSEFAKVIDETPVQIIKTEVRTGADGIKRKIVKRKVVKKILRKKKIKVADNDSVPTADAPKTEAAKVEAPKAEAAKVEEKSTEEK